MPNKTIFAEIFRKTATDTEKKKHKTYTVLDVAGYIINTNLDNGISMTYRRLNLFLYFAQIQSFISTNHPIFNGSMYLKNSMPCTPYGENHWKSFLPLSRITTYWDTSKGILQINKKPFCPHITMYDRELLDDVIKTLNKYSTKALTDIFKSHNIYRKALAYYDHEITWKMMCDYIKQLPKISTNVEDNDYIEKLPK